MIAKGFTLIELMVVVAIIGIIGAVAYPSYQTYITDTYRAQAAADMKVCAMALERHYSNGFTYAGGAGQCTLWSPADGPEANKQFTLSIPTLDDATYTIEAVPVTIGGASQRLTADGTQSTF